MIWVLLSMMTWSALPAQTPSPTLCIELPETVSPALRRRQLLHAIRSRLPRGRKIRVGFCEGPTTDRATWRAGWTLREGGALDLWVRGESLDAHEQIETEQLADLEIIQTIALAIVELVRPSIDALPAERDDPISGEPDALDDLREEISDRLQPAESVAKEPGILRLGIAVGPVTGIDTLGVAPQVELQGFSRLGPAWVGIYTSGAITFGRAAKIRTVAGEIETGLSGLYALGLWWLGGGIQGRFTTLSLESSTEPNAPSRFQFWDFGLHVVAAVWPWDFDTWMVGGVARTRLWWRPQKVLFRGIPVATQPYVDVWIGLCVQMAF